MSSNKDVFSIDFKAEKRVYTKILREWAKLNETNQYEMAIMLCATLYRAYNVLKGFISEKGLTKEFVDYFMNLEGEYSKMFQVIHEFSENVENKIIPRFGE